MPNACGMPAAQAVSGGDATARRFGPEGPGEPQEAGLSPGVEEASSSMPFLNSFCA